MILFFVRHGETEGNVKKLFYGQQDLPLTEFGRAQAKSLAPLLSKYTFDRVYASDLSRAVETAQLAIPGSTPITTPLLREYAMGSIDGQTFDQVLGKYGVLHEHYERFGGESPEDMVTRLKAFLTSLENDPCDRAIAFAHSGTMKGMVRLALGMNCTTGNLFNTNCNIAVFRYEAGRWLLSAWNLAGDLEGEFR